MSSRVGNVHYPVADMEMAVAFYHSAFGLEPKFVDGKRYAALDAGGTTLALAGPEEDVTGGRVAGSFKVDDVQAALSAIVAAGGSVVQEAKAGPHELRAVAADPWGNTLIVYGPE
jgi:predicted enzyme related to lactoylglutathione lyase